MTTFTHVLEVVVLVALYFGLIRLVGVVLREERDRLPSYEQRSHVRVLRSDES